MVAERQPRAATPADWPALRRALNEVFRPDGGDLTQELPLLFDPANQDNLRIITATGGDGGEPRVLAHAALLIRPCLILRRRTRVALIGAVFAAPDARGQGLGSLVLADALRRARGGGTDLVLASGDRGLYRRQGLEPVPPLARFRLPPAAAAAPATTTVVRDLAPEDLDAVAALHDAEDVQFARSADDWRRLLAAGRLVDLPATFSVAVRNGRVVAFLATQRATARADGTTRPRRILEVAGDRSAVVEVAPSIADELLVPGYDSTTIALCERAGWVRTTRQFLVTADPLTADARVIPWYGLDYL